MTSELSPEIWDHILSLCREKDDEGLFVSQKTLATCLRVSKTWYLLASPYLYSSPIIKDIHNFFVGSDKPLSSTLSESLASSKVSSHDLYLKSIEEGNTKLPLLHQIQHLRIYPHSLPEECDDEKLDQVINIQRDSYTQAKEILSNCQGVMTPRLKSISCDSYLIPTGDREREISDMLFRSIRNIKLNLLSHLQPEHWCEFDSPTMSLSGDVLKMTKRGVLPQMVEIHTTLEDPPVIQWGTKNRLTIREKEDVRKYLWPAVNNYESTNTSTATGERNKVGNGNENGYDNIDWPVDSVSVIDQETWIECICEMIEYSMPLEPEDRNADGLEQSKSESEIDGDTILEVYGIEKFLTISSSMEGVGENLPFIDESTVIEPKVLYGDIDMDCLASITKSRFTAEELSRRQSIYRSISLKIEERIRECLEINEQGQWIDTGKKAPTIKLYLASDYPGCSSCGQGKGDKWELDTRPRPPPRDDDSDWTDDDHDEDDQDDWDDDDDGHDFDVDDFIEYDDDDIYDGGGGDYEPDADDDDWQDEEYDENGVQYLSDEDAVYQFIGGI
ncbi:hypothetical protein L486_06184 [Kwoniella mangroviensis CBS 10435]|uniref:F-box domain-containing protein n=1 Tax=Kwoniella mangroviensis CBS 10435 TaxID=1331196 RepID=A0A1B9IL71_9TREE|nr:hypothetical protein L486_06184 [Kwoniella mangroviensis CBS 10435]